LAQRVLARHDIALMINRGTRKGFDNHATRDARLNRRPDIRRAIRLGLWPRVDQCWRGNSARTGRAHARLRTITRRKEQRRTCRNDATCRQPCCLHEYAPQNRCREENGRLLQRNGPRGVRVEYSRIALISYRLLAMRYRGWYRSGSRRLIARRRRHLGVRRSGSAGQCRLPRSEGGVDTTARTLRAYATITGRVSSSTQRRYGPWPAATGSAMISGTSYGCSSRIACSTSG
jgi:hypothetical protein